MKPTLITTINNFKTAYLDEPVALLWRSAYMSDESIAFFLTDEHKETLATATVNLSGYGLSPEDGHVFIKDYGENAGILKALIEADVISKPVRQVPCGYEQAHECKVLV